MFARTREERELKREALKLVLMEYLGALIFFGYSVFTAIQLERGRKSLDIDRRSVHKQLNEQLKLDKEIATELKLNKSKKFDIEPYLPLIHMFLAKKGKSQAEIDDLVENFENINGGD